MRQTESILNLQGRATSREQTRRSGRSQLMRADRPEESSGSFAAAAAAMAAALGDKSYLI